MFRKVLTVALLTGSLALTGCNAVRGVGQDVQSVANCTQDMINRGQC
ncbi:MAG: entericidin EcnA/B family protein [Pseudomonadota bacterium]|jgi:predicted small secreted protein|nr:entericidin EcnA/B family protein [Pseudomonadota bacterium]